MNDLIIQKTQSKRSRYDWINIEYQTSRIGKMRTIAARNCLIIYSIQIFPEFQGHGFGTHTIEYLKQRHSVLIADHVRPNKLGFKENTCEQFIYDKSNEPK